MIIMTEILEAINNSKKIAVFGHTSPDADCVGAVCAFSLCAKYLNKQIDAYIESIPDNLHFIADSVVKTEFIDNNYDLVIAFDVSTPNRLGKFENNFTAPCSITIDHHQKNEMQTTYKYVVEDLSSTCEILYYLIKQLNIKIDSEIATALFAGISGDTGGFKYNNTSSQTLFIGAELVNLGANKQTVNDWLFTYMSPETFATFKTALNNLKFVNGVGISIIANKELQKCDVDKIITHDYMNFFLSVSGTKIAIFAIEKEKGKFKVSLRAKPGYDVSKIAYKLGGGGHVLASACLLNQSNKNKVYKVLIELALKEVE